MKLTKALVTALLPAGALIGCASQNAPTDMTAATGGTSSDLGTGGALLGSGGTELSGSGGAASGGAAAGGSSTGGVSTGGGVGTGGSVGSGGSASGGASSGGSGGGSGSTTAFTCSQVTGFTVTSEWYLAGFENYVDDARWQLKWQSGAYIDLWGDPNSSQWSAAIVSPCAQASTSPDRIVLVVLDWDVMPQAQWEGLILDALAVFQDKYPNVVRYDLLTIVRGPDNQKCGGDPSATESVQIPAELDAALAAVAATQPDLIHVGPKFEGPDCAAFDGAGPHLLQPGVAAIATEIGEYFAGLQ